MSERLVCHSLSGCFAATAIEHDRACSEPTDLLMECLVREALTNAFRHAHAAKIETEIAYENTGVRLRIRDDGHGIDQTIVDTGRPGHWGLRGMRERAKAMGAELNIRSHPGAGTEVELSIPAEVAYSDSIRKSFWNRISRGSNGNNGDKRNGR
jgi:nitrate/nitrite-specific signal transduction histidine kinase